MLSQCNVVFCKNWAANKQYPKKMSLQFLKDA